MVNSWSTKRSYAGHRKQPQWAIVGRVTEIFFIRTCGGSSQVFAWRNDLTIIEKLFGFLIIIQTQHLRTPLLAPPNIHGKNSLKLALTIWGTDPKYQFPLWYELYR